MMVVMRAVKSVDWLERLAAVNIMVDTMVETMVGSRYPYPLVAVK